MKKLILRLGIRIKAFNMRTIGIVILSLSSMLLGFQCEDPYNTGQWYIVNSTDKTLTLSFPPNHYYKDRIVPPGHGFCFQEYRYMAKGRVNRTPYFDHLPEFMASHSSGKVSLDVLSANGDLLKRWSYSDKDLPGKNFFKEFGWRQHKQDERNGGITIAWVFEILPEDLD